MDIQKISHTEKGQLIYVNGVLSALTDYPHGPFTYSRIRKLTKDELARKDELLKEDPDRTLTLKDLEG